MIRALAAMLLPMVAFAILAAPVRTARAVAPNDALSYQGRLLNANGAPVADASLEFVFRLFDADAGGSCLWESDDGTACDAADETQTVALTDGLFSENIGSTDDPDGLSEAYPADVADVFLDNADVFLEVEIEGEILSPRKRIAAAPYALNAQSLDGIDSDGFCQADGTNCVAGADLWETGAFSTFEDDDDVSVGTSGAETLNDAGFSFDGASLFVASQLGVEGRMYTDDGLSIDDDADLGSLTIEGTALDIDSLDFVGAATITTAASTSLTLSPAGGDAAGEDLVVTAHNVQLTAGGAMVFSPNAAEPTALTITDTDYTVALSVGDNSIAGTTFSLVGTTALIDFLDFDVSADGVITLSPDDGGVAIVVSPSAALTTGLDVSDADITNGVSLGATTLLGTTATIAFTDFTVGSDGTVTLTPDDGGTAVSISPSAALLVGLDVSDADITNGISLGSTTLLGAAAAVDFLEFDVSATTGSVTINDGGNAGALSVEGTVLDIDSLDFAAAGLLTTTGAGNDLTLSPADQIIVNGGSTVDIQDAILNSVGNVAFSDDVVPDADGTRSFGSAALGWLGIFLRNVDDGTTVSLSSDGTGETDSGASVVGVFDEFGNSSGGNVQDALDDLDAAIASGGAGAMWTLSGSVLYPTDATNDLAVGGTTAAASPFGVDESANTVFVGEGSNGNGTLTFKASDADTGSLAYTTNDRFSFTGGDITLGSDTVGGVNAAFSADGDDFFTTGHIAAQDNVYADAFVAGDASTTFADGSITSTGATDLALSPGGGDITVGANDIEGTTATITFTDFSVGSDGLVVLTPDDGGTAVSISPSAALLVGLDVSDADITNGISLGSTTLLGAAAAVDFLEFDVSATTGSVTINDGGNAGALSVEGTVLDINSLDFVGAAAFTSGGAITFGDGGDTIAIDSTNWDVTDAGAASFGSTLGATGLSTLAALTANGDVTMNDAGADTILIGAAADTLTLASNTLSVTDDNWNVTEAGLANFVSIGAATAGSGAFTTLSATGTSTLVAVNASGLVTGTLGATVSGATTSVNASSNFATNVNTGTSTGAVSIGGGLGTVAVDSTVWDVTAAGAATFVSLTMGGAIDMANNLITNIGDAGTDFVAGGGLTLAGTLDANGNVSVADTDVAFDGASTTFTTTGAFTLTPGGAVLLGDGGDTMQVNSSDWDVSTAGDMTGIGAVTADGLLTVSRAGTLALFSNATDGASVQTAIVEGDRATPAADDEAYVTYRLSDAAGTQTEFGRLTWAATDVTDASEDGRMDFAVMTAGTLADEIRVDGVSLAPSVNDGNALGTTTLGWADLHLATGGVVNWANGEVTLTESDANTLTLGGGNLDFANVGLITNIGDAGTDFVAGGGLTLASAFTANGVSTFNSDVDVTLNGTENIVVGSGTGTGTNSVDLLRLEMFNNDGGANVQRGLAITNTLASTSATEALIVVDNADTLALTDAITVTGTGGAVTNALNLSNANIDNALVIGDNEIEGSAASINFSEFDVSATTGSVTIDDGGDAGNITIDGTVLDIDGLTFVTVGKISTTAGDIDLDASTDLIAGAAGDALLLQGATAGNDAAVDSPNFTLRGTYDSTAGAGVTSTAYNATIAHDVSVAAGSPSSNITFNVAGGSNEMTLSQAGDLVAIGGVTFGDTTDSDKFEFVTAVTTTDAFTMTADSVSTADVFDVSADGLTTGRGIFLERADNGTSFTSAAGLLTVSMLDATSSGDAANFVNSGTGSAVFVDQNGNTGSTINTTTGGALHIDNTGNINYGLTVYTDIGATASSNLAQFYNDNVGFDNYVVEIQSDATEAGSTNGTALRILQSEVDSPAANSVGTQALVIDTSENFGAADGAQSDAMILVREDVGGTPDTVFRVDGDGDLWADGTLGAGASDVAEIYPSTDLLSPGDIVAFDPMGTGVLRSTSAYQSTVMGAVSTMPGVLLGFEDSGYKIALTGRVPLSVTGENGPIAAGDPIAASSTAGAGMKSSEPGMIVGFALEGFSGSGHGTIMVFVNPQFYVGGVVGTDGTMTQIEDDVELTGSLTLRGSNDSVMQRMMLVTDVTDAADYRLSIENADGTSVAYVSNEGDFALAGRLYPSDRGAVQTSKYIYYDGASGMGGDFMRTNASGWATGSYDFAEMFPSQDALEPGDVVVFGTDDESVARSRGAAEPGLAGIVSTRPGFLAGDNEAGHYPVALAGRVPTKVSDENGDIAIGDPLTSSSTDGYAMKATEAGPIVGYALEPFDGFADDDKIVAFVNVSYWNGGATPELPGTDNRASTIVVTQSASNLTALNMSGNIYLSGNQILGVGRIAGLSDRWSIDAEGTIVTEGVVKTSIESYQGERVETAAVTSPEVLITLFGTATLENGEAVVRFEDVSPEFNDITSTVAPIRVLVTPNGPVSLYVYEKNNDGFGVRQVDGIGDGVTFDWMVSAYRKDYEPYFAEATEGVPPEEELEIEEETEAVEEPVGTEGTTGTDGTEDLEIPVEESPDESVDAIEVSDHVTDEQAPPVSPDTLSFDDGASEPSDSMESTFVEEPAP